MSTVCTRMRCIVFDFGMRAMSGTGRANGTRYAMPERADRSWGSAIKVQHAPSVLCAGQN
eukprot:3375339-Rhodomonas_salina.6